MSLISAGIWLTTAGVREFDPPGVPPPRCGVPPALGENSARLLANTLPTTAESRVAPICRKKLLDAVAMPTSRIGKEFWTMRTRVRMLRPSPRPITPR
ncbi:MAG: hypothetical protein JWP30_1727 [Homoserinimonas sp.]|nr:hypothetical protein [Homoserinimonas sp.]